MVYILVEGANQVGKTTLINNILPLFPNYTFIKLPNKVDLTLSKTDPERFDELCLKEIINLPRSGNLITDRGYISHVVYKVVRAVYNGKLDVDDMAMSIINGLKEIENVVRPYDLAFIFHIHPEDYDHWFKLHTKRFEFMEDPEKFTNLVYMAWSELLSNWKRRVIRIPAYASLRFQTKIVKLAKEEFKL